MTPPASSADDDPVRGRLPIDADLAPADPAQPGLGRRPAVRGGRAQPAVLAAIAGGAALGAPARYGVAQVIHGVSEGFPWATLWTNVSGSLALGVLLALILRRVPPTRYLRPFAATGFLGAYTTYSTFAVETDLLVKNGHVPVALAYAASSLVMGFLAVWAGIWGARMVPLPRSRGRVGP